MNDRPKAGNAAYGDLRKSNMLTSEDIESWFEKLSADLAAKAASPVLPSTLPEVGPDAARLMQWIAANGLDPKESWIVLAEKIGMDAGAVYGAVHELLAAGYITWGRR